MKKCSKCKWLVLADNGYSNYTVEETIASCILNANPQLPGVTGYGAKDEVLNAPSECAVYDFGEPTEIDVDEENKQGSYDLPDCERLLPYFKDDSVKAAVRAMGWIKINSI